MSETQPQYQTLIDRIGIELPVIGLYDAPDPEPFSPTVIPQPGECVFLFYRNWLSGQTLHLTKERFGCGGAGRWLFDVMTRSREDFISFLVDQEGLKASHALMERWIDASRPYERQHDNILIGPLKPNQWPHIKSVTFFINPDQLAAFVYGTQYHSAPEDPPPLISPFGAGCMELLPFADLESAQAAIGATDIAMRQHLPPEILTISVTKSMFQRLCSLDANSFLYKPFLKNLQKARGLPQ